jgi:diguanylate cyclase (GGDEF)-like protein
MDTEAQRERPPRHPVAARLRADFQLSVITLFGVSSAALIGPFAIYRAASGNWVVAALDAFLVLAIGAACAWAWVTGDTRRVGLGLSVVYSAGAVASAELLGIIGAFWMYPTTLANFFLVDRRVAWTLNTAAIGILALHSHGFDSIAQVASFVATCLLASFLSDILARRMEIQRRQLEQLATRDPLTGAHNRAALAAELAAVLEARDRDGAIASMALLDLDHFKSVNDRHGHATGDRVLVDFCRILRRHATTDDRMFRFGGEEFVLLMPGRAGPQASDHTERLRRRVADELAIDGGAVTVSCGVATLRPGETWEQWLRRADAALYRAKSNGRNRTEFEP